MQINQLSSLPHEVLREIYSFLDIKSLDLNSRVCKEWHHIIEQSSWRELAYCLYPLSSSHLTENLNWKEYVREHKQGEIFLNKNYTKTYFPVKGTVKEIKVIGNYLVCICMNCPLIYIFDLVNKELLPPYENSYPITQIIEFERDLIYSSTDGKITRIDLSSGKKIYALQACQGSIIDLKISHTQMVSLSSLGLLKIWDITTQAFLCQFKTPKVNGNLSPLVINEHFAACSFLSERTVQVFDLKTCKKIFETPLELKLSCSIALIEKYLVIMTGHHLQIWSLTEAEKTCVLEKELDIIGFALHVLPGYLLGLKEEYSLLIGGNDGHIHLVDLKDKIVAPLLKTSDKRVYKMAIKGHILMTGYGTDNRKTAGLIRIWNIKTKEIVQTLEDDQCKGYMNALSYSSEHKVLVGGYVNGMMIWDFDQDKENSSASV